MPDPAVVIAMREFKRGLLLREAGQMQEMARAWLDVERSLEPQIESLAQSLAEQETVTEAELYRLNRYKRLLGESQREFRRYAQYTDGVVTSGQGELAELGLAHSQSAIQLSYWPRVSVRFDRLPVEALENMVGLAGDGRPVGDLLRERVNPLWSPEKQASAWDRATRSLVNGTAQGWNPRQTARVMRDDLAGGLQKALEIARTEQLRVYREVHRSQYEASGVVRGQKRLTAHDDRVCPACIADEGTVYPLNVILSDHVQGRCTSVPVVEGLPEVTWLSGEDWFRGQDEGVQRSILGNGRYEAWREGQFEFGQLVTHQEDATWGGSIVPTALKELTG